MELGISAVVVHRATPKEDDFRPISRVPQCGYGAYNAYISAETKYTALGAPTLYDHPVSFYKRGDHDSVHGMVRMVFVGELPQEATADDLRHYFGRFDRILDVCIPKDPMRSGHRGFVSLYLLMMLLSASRRSCDICGQQVTIDSATPFDDAGFGPSHMISNPVLEPLTGYLGPYGRMDANLDYLDVSSVTHGFNQHPYLLLLPICFAMKGERINFRQPKCNFSCKTL